MTDHTPLCFGDNQLQATLRHEPNGLHLSLLNNASGKHWGHVPLAYLEVYDKAQFRLETLRHLRIDQVEATGNGAHVVLGDNLRQVQVGLWLRIMGGELVVTLAPSELYENKAAAYRVFSVLILPGLMRAGREGQMLLPLNTGILCSLRDAPPVKDRFMVYGEQERWELMPMLPVGAIHTPQGGLMCLAASGACDTECHVTTEANGMGQLDWGISFRQHWPDKVDFECRQLRYCPISPGADVVHHTAKRLRRHTLDDLGKPTLLQRQEESPELSYLLEAYTMKLFFGVENQGIMMQGVPKEGHLSFQQVMNFAEARGLLHELHDSGIDKIVTQCVGWNPRGHDGLWPTRFPIEERLGGEEGFRALIACGNALGFQMNVHDNYLSAYRASPDFDAEAVIHDLYGEPMGLGEWGGGITYILWALSLTAEQLQGEMHRVKALGLRGAGYLDAMGNPLYRNYHPRHRGTRGDYARGTLRILEACRDVYGSVVTECGFFYCLGPCDGISTAGEEWHRGACSLQWPLTSLLQAGKRVPLWQLALHGLVLAENQGETWQATMRCVLMGEHPRTEWSAHAGIMPVLDCAMIEALKAKYDVALKRFGFLQTLELMEHEEAEPGIERTRFEDGTEVIADFNAGELVVNGQLVSPPEPLLKLET